MPTALLVYYLEGNPARVSFHVGSQNRQVIETARDHGISQKNILAMSNVSYANSMVLPDHVLFDGGVLVYVATSYPDVV